MSALDVVQIIRSRKVSTRLDLMALAASWQADGKNDLAEFVANRGSKVVNDALETAKELSCAHTVKNDRLKQPQKIGYLSWSRTTRLK